jgi:hypothetical protein
MDITRKLELIANLKPGDPWPSADLGGNEFNYAPAISAMCSEALAEIQRLRLSEGWRERGAYVYPVAEMTMDWRGAMRAATIECDEIKERSIHPQMEKDIERVTQKIADSHRYMADCQTRYLAQGVAAHMTDLRPPMDEPKPDPWGSPFAMNTENWK